MSFREKYAEFDALMVRNMERFLHWQESWTGLTCVTWIKLTFFGYIVDSWSGVFSLKEIDWFLVTIDLMLCSVFVYMAFVVVIPEKKRQVELANKTNQPVKTSPDLYSAYFGYRMGMCFCIVVFSLLGNQDYFGDLMAYSFCLIAAIDVYPSTGGFLFSKPAHNQC